MVAGCAPRCTLLRVYVRRTSAQGKVPPDFVLPPKVRPRSRRRPVDHPWVVPRTSRALAIRYWESRVTEELAMLRWKSCTVKPVISGILLDGQHRASGIMSAVLEADRVLQRLHALADEVAADRDLGFPLGKRLRATAEQDTGIPSVVYDAVPGADRSRRVGWALHRTDVLEYAALDGSTNCVASFSDEDSWRYDLRQAEAALADAANRARAVKAAALVALKLLVGREYSFVDSVPPHEASPCGVLRLATPIVPGAPSVRSWPIHTTMTLAA